MKKRGATLVIVLVVTAALLIIGTAVSGSVINTMKLNVNYSANVDLELAAKSGLSILKNNLIKELSSVNKIENLPNEFEKIDITFSDSNSFKGIKVKGNRKYKKTTNDLGEDIYEYTITSIAYKESNSTIQKKEEQIISVNLTVDSVGNIIFNPFACLNVKGDIEVKENNQLSFIDSIASGGKIDINNQIVKDSGNNSELNSLNIRINQINVENFVNELGNDDKWSNIQFDYTLENSQIKSEDLNKIENKTVKVNNSLDFYNNNIETIELVNSTLVVEQSIRSNKPLTIILNNSNLIVKGGIEINNKINIVISNSSLMCIKQRIYSNSGININSQDSKLLVKESGVDVNEQLNIKLYNSDLYIKENIYARGIFTLESNNSNTITGSIDSSEYVIWDLIDSGFLVNGELYSRETFTTNIRNSAIIVMKNINSPSGKPVGYTINNNGKSFILVLGKLYFYKVDININAIGLIPSSEKVLNFINEFLTN